MRSAVVCIVALLSSVSLAAEDPPGTVRLSLERYEKLMRAAQRTGGPSVTWARGSISVVVDSAEDVRFAKVSLTTRVQVVGKGVAELVLLPGDVVLEAATVNGATATLLRRDGAHVALLPEGTDAANLSLSYLVPLRPDGTGRTLALVPLPPLPGSTISVTAAGRTVEIWPGANVRKGGDTVTASLPSSLAVAVRVGDESAGHRVRRVDYGLAVDAALEGVDIKARYEVTTKGAISHVRLAPANLALVEVLEGDKALDTHVKGGWHRVTLRGAGAHTVVASFRAPVDRTQGQPLVGLLLDKVPITRFEATIPGSRKVTLEPAIPLTRKVDGKGTAAVTTVSGYLPPSDRMTLKWTEARPEAEKEIRFNTETFQLVRIEEGVLRNKVRVGYDVIRGKTKQVRIAVPDGVVLYSVTGDGIEDWQVVPKSDTEPRQVRIYLGREKDGKYQISLELEVRIGTKEGTPLDIPVVTPLDAFRQTGVVALFDGDKVGFAPAEHAGYVKVGQNALPPEIRQGLTGNVSQAFRHIDAPKALASKVTTAQKKKVLYDGRVYALYTVKDRAIQANATVQVEVKSGRTDALLLSLPKGVTVLSVTAPTSNKKGELKDKDVGPGRIAYEVRFSQPLEGTIEVHLEFELVMKRQAETLALPDLRIVGAQVQEGSFGITAEPGIEVKPAKSTVVRTIDVSDLENTVRLRTTREIRYAFQYSDTPWTVDLEVKRHKTVETLPAVVSGAWLETWLYEDGHALTRATFQVKNVDWQFLRVALPEGAEVWTVRADGQPVKAVRDEQGRLAVPLRKGRTVLVRVVFGLRSERLGLFSARDLLGPQVDVNVTNLQWRILTPGHSRFLAVETVLQERDASTWKASPASPGADETPIPTIDEPTEKLYHLAVARPGDDPPALTVGLITTHLDIITSLWGTRPEATDSGGAVVPMLGGGGGGHGGGPLGFLLGLLGCGVLVEVARRLARVLARGVAARGLLARAGGR